MKLTIMDDNKTPQDIEQYQEHYSESGLFEKIKKVCKKAGMKAIYYVLLLYYVLMDENTPWEHKGIIIGKGGQSLKKVGTQARIEMEDFFQKKVFLRLFVKVDEDWRESKKELRKFGYEDYKNRMS